MTLVFKMPSRFVEAEDHISKDYLEKTVGHPVSDLEYYYFAHNEGGAGYTLPGYNYEGPGNSLHRGPATNNSDRFAEIHDTQYFDTKFRYDEGEIDRKTAEDEIFKEDQAAVRGFISNSFLEPVGGILGAAGLLGKDAFEGVFGTKYPDFPDNPHKHQVPMEVDKTPTKRPQYDSRGPGSTKQAKLADTPSKAGTIEAAVLPEDVDLPLDADMGLTGTGKEQASGGASSEGTPMYQTLKPYTDFGSKTTTYTKCHKFMTFGLAPTILTLDTAGARVLTSYLAEVPWHIPAFYMNESEFNLLPEGAHAVGMSVSIVYRGSTIQFETAAQTTGLATLNQINDIAYAHGLNRSGLGSNLRFNAFNADQPMLPTSALQPTYDAIVGLYRGMVRDYYGSNNDDTTFESDIPKHQVGRHSFLYNYWVNSLRGGSAIAAANKQFGGWPCLASAINQLDGKTVVNQVITSSSYKPKLAPLKAPLRMYGHGLPFPLAAGNYTVATGGNLVGTRKATITANANLPSESMPIAATATETTDIVGNLDSGTFDDPPFNIYTPIEKSQMGRTGYWGNLEPHIQPSVHIGVQPVPALTTSATLLEDGAFNKWTDTRAYWEVHATMTVTDKAPTSWPYATKANVPAGDTVVWAPTTSRPAINVDARNDGATFQGLYTSNYVQIPV